MILWYLLIRQEQIESMMTRHVDHKKITQKGLKFARLKRPFLGKNSTFIKNNLNVLTSILINLIESIDKYILYSFVCFD